MALQTGILVAFTQLIPEHQVQVFGVVKVRVKVRQPILGPKASINCKHAALTNGIRNAVYCYGAHWLPIALDSHSMGMASIMALLEILQKEQGRLHRWRVLRR